MKNFTLQTKRLSVLSVILSITLILTVVPFDSAFAVPELTDTSSATQEETEDVVTNETDATLTNLEETTKSMEETADVAQQQSTANYLHGWVWRDPYWYYYEHGVLVRNDWRLDSRDWCYLDNNGRTLRNTWAWLYDSDGYNWYYFNDSSNIIRNKWQTDSRGWCFLDFDGHAMKSGGPWHIRHPWIDAMTNVTFTDYTAYLWPFGGKL